MSMTKRLGIMAVALTCLSGCPVAEPETSSRALIIRNDTKLNGIKFNGIKFNGIKFNGIKFNGIKFNGIKFNTAVLGIPYVTSIELGNQTYTEVSLDGSVLKISNGRQTLQGAQLAGSVWRMTYQDEGKAPVPFSLRFDSVRVDPSVPGQDVWLYRVSFRLDSDPPQVPWETLCQDERGEPDSGIPVKNMWNEQTGERIDDSSAITFACRDFAIGKCVTFGYRPWAKVKSCTGSGKRKECNLVGLTDHHQACTRMIRADYCGNGVPYTVNGTIIDIYDYLEPPINVPETDWDIEARWTPKGALCLSEPRHPELLTRWRWPDCDGDGRVDRGERFRSCNDPSTRNQGLLVTRVNDRDNHGRDDDRNNR
jgi:hypothetical protein